MTARQDSIVSSVPSGNDARRAEGYALLARMFGAEPVTALIERIRHPAETYTGLSAAEAKAWGRLQREASHLALPALVAECRALFEGSPPLIELHGSRYAQPLPTASLAASEAASKHRSGARAALGRSLPEDHLAVVSATMHALIQGIDQLGPAPLSLQRVFFSHHIDPWFRACCGAIRDCPIAEFYRIGAEWAQAFLEREREEMAAGEA